MLHFVRRYCVSVRREAFVCGAMAGAGKLLGMDKLRAQNILVASGLTAFVGGVYFYTMKAVGSGDDLQEAVQKMEKEKAQQSSPATSAATAT